MSNLIVSPLFDEDVAKDIRRFRCVTEIKIILRCDGNDIIKSKLIIDCILENKKRILEKQNEYDKTNKDKINKYQKHYRENNKEILKKRKRDNYYKNKSKRMVDYRNFTLTA